MAIKPYPVINHHGTMILLPVNSPLPAVRNPDAPTSRLPEGADFVDDETVRLLIAGPVCRRGSLFTEEAFLTAEPTDFAGWRPITPRERPRTLATPTPPVLHALPAAPPPRTTSPAWMNAAAAVFFLSLLGIAILSQHPVTPAAAKWLPAQPAAEQQTAATTPPSPQIPQDLTSASR